MLKAHDVAAVIEERVDCFEFDPMSLQKLLYYVQAWHLAIKGDPLFEGHFEAGPEGPVLPEVLNVHPRKSDPVKLNDQVSDLIWLVVRTYGYLSPGELTVLAKTEAPWRDARAGLPEDARSANIISDDAMAGYVKSYGRLQGFWASDLAGPGLYVDGYRDTRPFSVRAVLDSLGPEFENPPGQESPFPSANWESCGDESCECRHMKGRRPVDHGA